MKTESSYCHFLRFTFAGSGFFRSLLCALSLFCTSAPLFAAPGPVNPGQIQLASADNAGEKIDDLPPAYGEDWLSKIVVVPDYDLYYTSLGVHIPLTKEPIPNLGDASEEQVYRHLFLHSLSPRFLLIEASVFPMPLAGVALKKYTPNFYRHAGGDDFNLIESVTTGFPEPYAATLFLGDIVDFAKPGEKQKATNKGYMGYLFSYSNEHIRRNTLIPDNNYEFEWKLKGERMFRGEQLSWSFRIGAKLHDNPDIKNAIYLGVRRNNMSCNSPFLSWLDNTDLQMRLDFSQAEFTLLRQEYLIGKSYPIKNWQSAFKLDVGLIWESPYLYNNQLRYLDHSGLTFVIRPQIEF